MIRKRNNLTEYEENYYKREKMTDRIYYYKQRLATNSVPSSEIRHVNDKITALRAETALLVGKTTVPPALYVSKYYIRCNGWLYGTYKTHRSAVNALNNQPIKSKKLWPIPEGKAIVFQFTTSKDHNI